MSRLRIEVGDRFAVGAQQLDDHVDPALFHADARELARRQRQPIVVFLSGREFAFDRRVEGQHHGVRAGRAGAW